jgi:hypothetical protein
MKCPICDKSFASEEQLTNHLEYHKNNSILNSPRESNNKLKEESSKRRILINTENFFGKEKFEELVSKRLKQIDDLEELVQRRNFVEQTKKIIGKYPFVYLPSFIDDLFEGKDSKELLEKYSISYYVDLKNIVEEILKFDRTRYLQKKYYTAFEMNMQISTWKEKYQILKDNCDFFKNELLELLFFNLLRSFIIIMMTDYVEIGISKENIISKSRLLKNNYDIFKFIDKSLETSFEPFFGESFEDIAQNILNELIDERILRRKIDNYDVLVGKLSIDKIKQNIINELKYNNGSQTESAIRTMVLEEYPSLRLIPGLGIWKTALNELVNEKIIHLEFKSNFKQSFLVFLNESYEKIQQTLHQFDITSSEFHGRKISPEEFVMELRELEKGDFEDKDDQVTRIAGLVLAESVKLQSLHEDILDFDFSINLTNYNFRREQLEAIAKLNFKIHSDIFHCKVMIDESLTLKKYNDLKDALPENNQGIVVTFKKIPDVVRQQIAKNDSIQIMDEEGIKIWVSITSVIPSRKGSIAKLYFDPLSKLENKIVKINSIHYEKGLASVEIFPEMQEALVLIRSLEEISLNEDSLSVHDVLSENYFNFLKKLSIIATNTFEEGFNTPIKSIEKKWVKNYPKDVMELIKDAWIVEFDHVKVEIDLNPNKPNSIFKCSCYYMIDQEHSYTLCKHIVASLNQITIQNFLSDGWNSKTKNLMERAMILFLEMSVSSTIQKIAIDLNGNQLIIFKNYLENYADLIESK